MQTPARSIYHLHPCTYAGNFDSVQVTFYYVPAHVHNY